MKNQLVAIEALTGNVVGHSGIYRNKRERQLHVADIGMAVRFSYQYFCSNEKDRRIGKRQKSDAPLENTQVITEIRGVKLTNFVMEYNKP